MRNIDEHNITAAVIDRFASCKDERLREILSSLVTNLHDFVRQTGLTEDEWRQGIRFLTETGHKCNDKRQEFILLSDILGVSMLMVALNQKRPTGATEATVFGPFHTADAKHFESDADIAPGAPGDPLSVELSVVGMQGEPVAGATVDVWQADEEGLYDVQRAELGDARRARGVFKTDPDGRIRFQTIMPTAYPVPVDGPVGEILRATDRHPWRPAHLHFLVEAPGYRTLITHIFRDRDPYLDSDAVFGVRSSLIGNFVIDESGNDGKRASYRLAQRIVLAPDARVVD